MRSLEILFMDYTTRCEKSDKKLESVKKRNKHLHAKLEEYRARLDTQTKASQPAETPIPEEKPNEPTTEG